MKNKLKIITGCLAVIIIFLLANSMYIVQPDEVAIVQRLGEITTAVIRQEKEEFVRTGIDNYPALQNVKLITERGLQVKVPFIDQVEKYSAKYLTYTSRKATINTSDKRKLDVQMYDQYRM